MFVIISHYLNELVIWFIQNQLTSIILGAAGLSGGIWFFIVKFGLTKIWQKVEPEIESAAHLSDQKTIDDKNNDQYQKDMTGGADEKKLIDDESKLINGKL